MEESYCSDCKGVTAVISDHSTGDTICLDCGLVLEAYLIDDTAEWRTFYDEPANNDPHRVGDKSNPLLSNNGLTTLISMPKGGESQSQYPSSKSFRRFNNANLKDPDKGLIEAFKAIEAMSDRLGLVSTVKDLANEIFKKMEDVKSCKGRYKNAMMAACLFVACKRLEKSMFVACLFACKRLEKSMFVACLFVAQLMECKILGKIVPAKFILCSLKSRAYEPKQPTECGDAQQH